MVKPHRAPVRPRVIAPASGETLWLEDVVQAEEKLALSSSAGGGKSMALAHIASVFPDRICTDGPVALILKTRGTDDPLSHLPQYRLAPWGIEDCFDYLKATHPDRARALTARLATDPDFARLEGNAQLLTAVMDRMADDADLVDIRSALLRAVSPSAEVIREAAKACFVGRPTAPPLVRHAVVRKLLSAQHVINELVADLFVPPPEKDIDALVDEIALGIARNPTALSQIRYLASHGRKEIQPLCAGIAHATRTGWRPDDRKRLVFDYAKLDGADWPGIRFVKSSLGNVRLVGANLADAVLDDAYAVDANLAGAVLRNACISWCHFNRIRLSGADLREARIDSVDFRDAILTGANLDGAQLTNCRFQGAVLKSARFIGAALRTAYLCKCTVDGADFTEADLSGANLSELFVTKMASIRGARLTDAMCCGTVFEGLELPNAEFTGANLRGAIFTHSRMRNASFRGADLVGAGLADVDWEGADLRSVNLNRASFHLGTSRSGLIFSTTPCEGSRTGFYTDDFQDRDRAPEEIRKANLRGADLRGAKLDGVDLYLVDLRGAKISPKDVPHLRKCGAILDTRALET
jgi:uncharacterized protein YjbI with pentapeptide repeats